MTFQANGMVGPGRDEDRNKDKEHVIILLPNIIVEYIMVMTMMFIIVMQ